MATNNAINNSAPITVPNGGTGLSTITQNGILYGNDASAIGVTTAGTAGQLLTSNGAGVAPTFQAGGPLVLNLIQTQTAANSATITFTSGITSTYITYLLVWSAVVPATNTALLQLTVSDNGGSSYLSSGYQSGINSEATNGGGTFTNTNSTALFRLSQPYQVLLL
jgi:hypothetical protein